MPGNATVKCPKQFGHLYVEVRRQNRKVSAQWDTLKTPCTLKLTGGKVDNRDASTADSTTYDNLCAGGYTLNLTPATEETECDIEVEIEQKGTPKTAGVAVGAKKPSSGVTIEHEKTQMQYFRFYPYELLVEVVAKDTKKKLKGVTVKATAVKGGKQLAAQVTGENGLADFGVVASGSQYNLAITLSEEDAKKYGAEEKYGPAPAKRFFSKPYLLEVDAVSKVTPKIEMEYKVVLLDRNLAQYQETGEAKIYADPTYIKLSLEHSNSARLFKKGGTVKFAPENVDAYTDKECKTKLKDKKLTNDQLKKGLKLYLKGKTAGKFNVTLDLEDPGDKMLAREKNPAKEEMGVVELKAELHQHDMTAVGAIKVDPDTDPIGTYHTNLRDKALPAQKALTDQEKVKVGRLLHAQAAGSHGRAKLLVKKIDASQWPDGTDDYELVLNKTNVSGAVAIYDKEFDDPAPAGTLQAFPVKAKVKDLKAQDKELWVEGTTATKKRREVRLDLGLDRAEPMDKHATKESAKRNGDWARFTVVKINEVKLDYTAPRGKANAWDAARERFYINFKADSDGRKVTIQAQLSEKIKDVTLHFMLAEDKDNRLTANWGVDLPATWKWKGIAAAVKHTDKADRKDLLHLSATTDANGKASKELTLSRFGGDKFLPACYIDQDPHLAKYIHGHADLQKKKPVFAAKAINVWRKFWYKEVKVKGIVVAGFGNAADTYVTVKAEMVAATAVEMTRNAANALATRAIFKKHMVSFYLNDAGTDYVNNYPNDNGDALVVGDDNESSFFALATAEADKPVMIPMLNAHALWVADGVTASQAVPWFRTTGFPLSLTADKELIDPPIQGGTLFSAGLWVAQDWDPAANGGAGAWGNARNGNLAAADISLDPGRSDPRAFQVKKPAGIVVSANGTRVKIAGLTLRAGKTYLGTSYDDGIVNSYSPNNLPDFIDTIDHEVGHSFKQVTKVRPAGIPAHPNQYDKDGSHCNYNNKSCLMYESGPQATAIHRYCSICHPYVLVQDMSSV